MKDRNKSLFIMAGRSLPCSEDLLVVESIDALDYFQDIWKALIGLAVVAED